MNELLWKQRSRVMWLKEGDKISKFFHAKSSNRRRRNRIERLQSDGDDWLEGTQLKNHIVAYFQELFTANTDKTPLDL